MTFYECRIFQFGFLVYFRNTYGKLRAQLGIEKVGKLFFFQETTVSDVLIFLNINNIVFSTIYCLFVIFETNIQFANPVC